MSYKYAEAQERKYRRIVDRFNSGHIDLPDYTGEDRLSKKLSRDRKDRLFEMVNDGMSFTDVAKSEGVSRERIRQIYRQVERNRKLALRKKGNTILDLWVPVRFINALCRAGFVTIDELIECVDRDPVNLLKIRNVNEIGFIYIMKAIKNYKHGKVQANG